MYLDTLAAVDIGNGMFRYCHIGTWDLLNWSMLKDKPKQLIALNKKCTKGILKIRDNEVTLDILKTTPCNGIVITDANGSHYMLETTPEHGANAEEYIQAKMKDRS